MTANRKGLLLVNLGTPDAPETGAVRRYLREFLSDPRVVDLHPVGRWFLLNCIILPFRPPKSARRLPQGVDEGGLAADGALARPGGRRGPAAGR